MIENIENYENLANAIVVQAVTDYRDVCRRILKYDEDTNERLLAVATRIDLDRFFNSRWYGILTDVDSKYLIREVRLGLVKKFKTKKEYKLPISVIYRAFVEV